MTAIGALHKNAEETTKISVCIYITKVWCVNIQYILKEVREVTKAYVSDGYCDILPELSSVMT